jgi:hypothetical protein
MEMLFLLSPINCVFRLQLVLLCIVRATNIRLIMLLELVHDASNRTSSFFFYSKAGATRAHKMRPL